MYVTNFPNVVKPYVPNINEIVDVNHSLTVQAMEVKLKNGETAWGIFEKSVRRILKK